MTKNPATLPSSSEHRRGTRKIVFVLSFLTSSSPALFGQEVDCSIDVNYESVSTTNKDLLRNLANDLSNYVNDYSWGDEQLEEKITCTMNVFVKSATGDNRYSAQVFIGSQRPILEPERSSPVVRIFDENWEFTYIQNRPINHTPYTFNDLASFLDFYVYLILGYDYDTYEELGGTPWFQKAADVASLGRSSGQKGWQNVTGTYSRTQLVDEILNPKFTPLRSASYVYHFAGLDSLAFNSTKAYTRILSALQSISQVRKTTDPRSLALRIFFDAKFQEIGEIFLGYPDPLVYSKLIAIDPAHQITYEEYRARREE